MHMHSPLYWWIFKENPTVLWLKKQKYGLRQRGQCIWLSVVFTPPPPSHHGNVRALPVISLLLTYAVRWWRLAYPYDWREVSWDPIGRRAWAS
jgi:hypothetical protein